MNHLWTPWRMSYLKRGPQPDATCVFCRKAQENNDVKNHILHRGEHCFVILNLYPYNNGHLMVIPYQHTGRLDELNDATLLELLTLTQKAVQIIETVYNPHGFNIGINLGAAAGAGIVDHIHQHVVPRWGGDTNYLSTVGQTRTIPEWIDETYVRLHEQWKD
ncbi:MAG: HIT domain-containing protein [Anaerolineae bacterium]|nr:HIT domain-containing protein [Anaerolineae bacterium]